MRLLSAVRRALGPSSLNRKYSLMPTLLLGLGLGAVGLTYAVVNTVLIRPLDYPHPERIVAVSQTIPFLRSSPTVCTGAQFQRWQRSDLFEFAALLDTAEYTLGAGGGRPERVYGASVTPEFFHVFGVQPILGRGLFPEDSQEQSHVIVLSHELWARRFASDRGIVGKSVRFDETLMTVIGVMPAQFNYPRFTDLAAVMSWAPEQTEFWTPFVITPKIVAQFNFNYFVIGRLRAGVTPQQAAAKCKAITTQIFREQEIREPAYRDLIEQTVQIFAVHVTPLRESMASGIHNSLWMVLAAVALLLVLVLFNLGNLLLTQNANRLREYTVRKALGASRWQLFRESLLEQVMFVGMASVVSLVLMTWGISIVKVLGANRIPRLYELSLSPESIALVLGLSLVTAVLFGALSQLVVPASAMAFSLRSESRTSTGDRRTNVLKSSLIVAEIAVSLVLCVGAGLLLKSFSNVIRIDPGFNAHDVLTATISFGPENSVTPAKRLRHVHELLAAFRSIPGVKSASIVNRLPLTGETEIHGVHALGKPLIKSPDAHGAEYRVIDAAYFRTMGIRLVSGRFFRPDDPAKFVVIDAKMAELFWPGENPVGKQVTDDDNPPFTVIGVVANVHNGSLEQRETMQYYQLIEAQPYYSDIFVIRSRAHAEGLIRLVQQAVWRVDPNEPVTHPQTMDHVFAAVTLQRRVETTLLTGFAAVALFLSAIGLFSVASLSVSRRSRELGIRLALGATGVQVARLEMSRAAITLAIGLVSGIAITLLTVRAAAAFLYGVTPFDTEIYSLAMGVMSGAALLAAWIPAWRASRIDPALALRSE